ncbi:DNA cytosine methyltransferase [Paenibacillus sp. MMS18-CY102]|uniref:DNA cytosine methyltransferase n=1 Tax=Paenibacillus sp. MMS18-CY102 TaxID=2682849 RepID=UPI001365A5CE|nr:DNA cytosine methyltransferase [Paenibacillus sp. MMS18-CY102]MWC26650.1 DNA cytosine methyltransferase [Paenibacillus sp. MMS18-CY102]
MRVLVACEESQAVTVEFRKFGHEAYSCDIQPCSGGHPEWHIQQDATIILKDYWDMIIAFPPCTYLTNAGAVRLRVKGEIQEDRLCKAREAREFFMKFYNTECTMVAIENPLPGKIHELPAYTQIIEPYMFGDPWKKRTCLWLRGLEPLEPTNIVKPKGLWVGSTSSRRDAQIYSKYELSSNRDAKIRSKTFPGIAAAMAAQWGTDYEYRQLRLFV